MGGAFSLPGGFKGGGAPVRRGVADSYARGGWKRKRMSRAFRYRAKSAAVVRRVGAPPALPLGRGRAAPGIAAIRRGAAVPAIFVVCIPRRPASPPDGEGHRWFSRGSGWELT
ncbi:hypothetical protein [Xanthobacter sediminis]|uniref:hypothetical protein n=1 Tax=Xanthobacter sediminis TaxID=3119926 RepID=UPI003726ABA8